FCPWRGTAELGQPRAACGEQGLKRALSAERINMSDRSETMKIDPARVEAVAREAAEDAAQFLMEIIRFPSTSGREHELMEHLYERFVPLADKVEKVPFPPDFRNDPEYSFPI